MTMNRVWLILDATYLCHRAKHVFGELSYGGSATGVIYGFLKDLEYLEDFFQTKYVIFCWDYGKGIRKTMNKDYKKKRQEVEYTEEEQQFENAFREQMKLLHTEYLRTIGYRNIFYQKGYEADDIIASVCQNLPKGDTGYIVSADQDLYQLLSDNIAIYHPQKRKIITAELFEKEHGIKPEQWSSVKTLAGCISDNILGIPGVGDKTAIKFLTGQLKPESKIYNRIISESQIVQERNYPLVKLPLKGTKVFRLKKDKRNKKGYNEVIEKLGMKSLRKA